MKYKAVFFDFDGTLMDTSVGIYAGGRYAMEKAGLPIAPNTNWRSFIGPPLDDCFRIAFDIKDDAKILDLVKYYREFYEATGRYQASFYPGILDTIKALKKKGYKLAIASMKNEDLVIEMCQYFKVENLFDELLGLDLNCEVTKADLLKEGFKRMNLKPSEAVLVGDTNIDQQGATQAGCAFIAVDWGFGFEKGATGTISAPSQILDLV
jgi:phosphoglycolate phosphatase